MLEKITAVFIEKFAEQPIVFSSPGRINILGEHTDYNEGFVLPAAIDKCIYVAISKREDKHINLYACDFKETYSTDTGHIEPAPIQWPNYILGVVDQLQKQGHTMGGFNLVIDGNIPIGAGLSSSAAVECAVAFALNEIFEFGLSRMQMAPLAQKAEHVFAGVNCGIMDQFASMFGKKDHAIKLDCRSLEYEYVPIELTRYKLILFNSNVKHNLASSEYNTRRKQCEEGVAIIAKDHPAIKSLRDVTPAMLNAHAANINPVVFKRCKYVIEENQRLLGACDDLKRGDVKALGKKMFETHYGLQHDYEVSCRELDFLVDYVKNNDGVAGARMVGGGFGGCTINLIKENAAEKLVEQISAAYQKEMKLTLSVYSVSVEDGTNKI